MAPNDGTGNIFFNKESLAFSMPLILLCSSYAYFKFIPLEYGLPILGAIGVMIFINLKIQARKNEKLQNLDETVIDDLVGDEDDNEADRKAKKAQQAKKKAVERRLAAEQKKAEKAGNNKKGDDDDDDDDDNVTAFAKGSRQKQKNT